MKFLSVLFLTIALVASHTHAYYSRAGLERGLKLDLNAKLINLIEKVRVVLENGNETMGIPIMDPLLINHQKISSKSDMFSGDLTLNGLELTGLSNFEIEKAVMSLVGLKTNITLQWPYLKGTVDFYKLKGVLVNFLSVYGEGPMKFVLEDLVFSSNFSVVQKEDKFMKIKGFTSSISIGNSQISIDGLFNDQDLSDVTSAIASDLMSTIVRNYQKRITEIVNGIIITQADQMLSSMTLKDLMAVLNE